MTIDELVEKVFRRCESHFFSIGIIPLTAEKETKAEIKKYIETFIEQVSRRE